MNPFEASKNDLLFAARERGREVVGGTAMPMGLDHFAVYAGLIDSALELSKLIKTEKRDLAVIENHYAIATANIAAAFEEVEMAMRADFGRDQSLKDKTFEAINQLIAAGQYEIASEFHKRLIDGFKRRSIDAIIDLRNGKASGGPTMRLS